MRVLNAVQRVLLLLVAIPAIVIVVDIVLRMIKARSSNPIVAGIRSFAGTFILKPYKDVFAPAPKQSPLQDAIVALAALGLLALVIIFVFRALRAMVGARRPRVQPAAGKSKPTSSSSPAPAAPEHKTEVIKSKPATAETTRSETASDDPTSSNGTGTAPANDDTSSSSSAPSA